jgi:hypothetical protein
MTNLRELLKSGALQTGEKLIWKRRVSGKTHTAEVTATGEIVVEDGTKHRTPSRAAKHLNGGKSVDGWIVWKLVRTSSPLGDLRK